MDHKQYNRHSNFTTPDDYFEKLTRKIKECTCDKAESKKKKDIALPRFAWIINYAAMIAITAVVATHIITGNANNTGTGNTAETVMIDGLDDYNFVENMLASYPIDEYTFYCCLTEEEE